MSYDLKRRNDSIHYRFIYFSCFFTDINSTSITSCILTAGYDTMKGYRTDEWSALKQTATKIKELMKELHMFCWSVFQLVDETVFTDVFELSSNNIANAKQMKHVVDVLMIGKAIRKNDYHKYQYISFDDDWGEPTECDLDHSKEYFAIVVDKNRGGNKKYIPLFEINLDYNVWDEVGYLVKKKD